MIVHAARKRPDDWKTLKERVSHGWAIPFVAFEWVWEWVAFGLSNWRFLEVLEYLGSLSVLIGVIFYFSESGDRIKQRHYQAWQVINTAQGKGGSGGRIEALHELNDDHVSLVGVDVSSSYLRGVMLRHADLTRADFSAADVRDSDLDGSNCEVADFHSANFRNANLSNVSFVEANLNDTDLVSSNLGGSDFEDADLSRADLRHADLRDIRWQKIGQIKGANIADVRNAPEDFTSWALQHGAIQSDRGDQ
jgi:Pentapeptide repeats (9 copies)/Pentapeptide repeats (8 copies)